MRRLFMVLLFSALPAYAGSTPPFTTSPLSFPGVPNSVTLGSDGNIWLIDRAANKVGRLTPAGGYTTFAIPTANAIASGITLGPDGNAWFAEFGPNPNKIARVTPDGVITEFPLPAGKSLDSIAAGPDGNVWFTESQSSNGPPVYFLGHISTADATIGDFALPTNGRAQGLVSGADGNLWVGWVESSGNKYDVLRVTPSGTLTTFPLPATSALNALGATMLLGPDGNIWFTFQNNLARVKPEGTVTLYAIPTANANMLPAGLAIGMDSNIWFSEFSSGKIGQLIVRSATDSGQATINESDSLGGLPQAMFLLPAAPARTLSKGSIALGGDQCPGDVFIVVKQDSTSSPPKFEKHTLRPYEACADVYVIANATKGGAGATHDVSFTVGNNGPSDAPDVLLDLRFLPKTLSSVFPAAEDGQCAFGGGTVTCTWSSLPKNAKKRVSIEFVFPTEDPLAIATFTGNISSTAADAGLKNNKDVAIWWERARAVSRGLLVTPPEVVNTPSRGH